MNLNGRLEFNSVDFARGVLSFCDGWQIGYEYSSINENFVINHLYVFYAWNKFNKAEERQLEDE